MDNPTSSFDPGAGFSFSSALENTFDETSADVPYSNDNGLDTTLNTTSNTSTRPKRKSSRHTTSPAYEESESPAREVHSNPTSASPNTRSKKKRKTNKGIPSKVIPSSFQDCSEADQELITMRDAGEEWRTIRARWEEMTGEKTGNSTLPNRYARLKSNFTVIKEEDNARLIEAKRTIEHEFEKDKWDLIAKAISGSGGATYDGVVLQRQYKKLMLRVGAQPPPGVRDPDFDIDIDEEGQD